MTVLSPNALSSDTAWVAAHRKGSFGLKCVSGNSVYLLIGRNYYNGTRPRERYVWDDHRLCPGQHTEQDLSLQLALAAGGLSDEQIFSIRLGTHTMRPGLSCLQALASGDLLVSGLGSLGAFDATFVTVMTELADAGGLPLLCDGALDTTTATGELVFHMFRRCTVRTAMIRNAHSAWRQRGLVASTVATPLGRMRPGTDAQTLTQTAVTSPRSARACAFRARSTVYRPARQDAEDSSKYDRRG